MAYLIFAAVMAAILITLVSLRHRPPKSPAKSVDDFQRALKALGPPRRRKRKSL